VKQRTDEWLAARVGKITGTRFGAVMDLTVKGEPKAARKALVQTLALERLTGQAEEVQENEAMRHGTETEPKAKAWLEFMFDTDVIEHGFELHPVHDFIGVSPDGSLASAPKNGIEIKCPISKRIHMERLQMKRVSEIDHAHYWQMQGQMMVMGWSVITYVSFHPGMPPGLQGWYMNVDRDDAAIKRLENECRVVNAEANVIVAEMKERMKC
jgi:putative phage-type endonuclease